MARILRSARWAHQPAIPQDIDTSHHIGRDVIEAGYALAGLALWSAGAGRVLVPSNAGSGLAASELTADGYATKLNRTGTSDYSYANLGRTFSKSSGTGVTMVWRGVVDSLSVPSPLFTSAGDGAAQWPGHGLVAATDGSFYAYYGNPSSSNYRRAAAPASTLAAGKLVTLIAVCRAAANWSLYKDGDALSVTHSGIGTYGAGTAAGTLNRRDVSGNITVNQWMYIGRALDDAEVRDLTLNLNQIWRRPQRRIWVPAGAGGPTSYTLSAAHGSFTLSGQSASLLASRVLSAAHGSIAVSGQDAALLKAFRLIAAHGTVTLSGQAAALLAARRLEAAHGTFALSGQDATFLKAFRLLAEHGMLSLSGQDAELLKASRLTASHGVYSIAGQDAALIRAFRLLAANGMIAVSGQSASLLKVSRLTAEHGTVTLAGQDASLLRAYVMSAAHGAISISGQSAQLRRVFRLVAEHGAVAVVGQDAGFLRAYVMVAEHGTFVLSGQAATLFKPYIPQDVRVTISEMETGEEIVVVLAADEVKFTDAAESLAFTVFEETVH